MRHNSQLNLRLKAEQKAMLMRAAALRRTSVSAFVLQPALREAEILIKEAEGLALSGRDSIMVLKLLETPPVPNPKLRAAITRLTKAVGEI